MLSLGGCMNPEEFKEQADEEVYSILDQKWKENFGFKANYKVTDGEPNSLEVIKMIPSSGILSQAQAVGISTKFNRNYQSQKESLYLSALDLTSIRHQYALQWFGTIDAAYTVSEGTEETPFNSQVGVSKQFLLGDGILIGTGLAVDWTRFLTGDPEASLGSVLSATLEAPLLGNGAGKAARENLTQAERRVLYNIRTFNRYRNQRLVGSTNQLRMEVEVGKRPPYDLGEAEQRLLTAEQNVVSAVQNYEQALDFFKIKLALPTDVEVQLDPNELMILDTIGVSQPDYSAEDAIQMALVRRLDLANVRDEVDDAERKLILAAEGLGPQIDFTASANVESTPDTEVARLRFHEGTYSLGVAVDLPFDRLDERNTYRESLISVRTQQRDYDERVDTIKLQIRASYRTLVQTAESYRIQKIGLELAKKRVDVEKLSLQYGRGTVRLLLDSEDALVEAQNEVVAALVDHMIAKLNFFRDVGVLRVKPDGMWEQEEI
ncbi:MAG: TolC family protein [Planctomycetota bacterium]